MNLRRLLTLEGINFWYIAIGGALNLFWTLALTVFVSVMFVKQLDSAPVTTQLIMMVACFGGPFLFGWLCGALAGDGRGPTYGVYGSFAAVLVLAVVALPIGFFGIMLIIAALAGGLNGGLFSVRGHFRQ